MPKAEVNAIAKKNLPYNNMVMVVTGNKAKLFDKVKKLGYDVIELDTDGNPILESPTPPIKK